MESGIAKSTFFSFLRFFQFFQTIKNRKKCDFLTLFYEFSKNWTLGYRHFKHAKPRFFKTHFLDPEGFEIDLMDPKKP